MLLPTAILRWLSSAPILHGLTWSSWSSISAPGGVHEEDGLEPSSALLDKHDLKVVPLPRRFTIGHTVLCLSEQFTIHADPGSDFSLPDDLLRAAARTTESVLATAHQFLSPHHGAEFLPVDGGSFCQDYIRSLVLEYDDKSGASLSVMENAVKRVEERNEGYVLRIEASGQTRLKANSTLGLFRGLSTFEQLFYRLAPVLDQQRHLQPQLGTDAARRSLIYAPFAPYDIEDYPSFPWRSFLLDTSRHYFPIRALLKHIETMAMVKLNVFHWSVSQDYDIRIAYRMSLLT